LKLKHLFHIQKITNNELKMKILIISRSHPYKKAGIVAKDILDGFKKYTNHEVKLIVKFGDKYPDKDIISVESYFVYTIRKIFNKLFSGLIKYFQLYKTNIDYNVQEINLIKTRYKTKRILNKIGFKPDAILIFFTSGFITAKNIYELQQLTKAKIFWQLPDMAPFTGLCHYSWDCNGYENDCGNCPAINSNKKFDISYRNLSFKKEYLSNSDIELLIGSDWLIEKAKNSAVFKNNIIHKVFLPLNTNYFYPFDEQKKELLRIKNSIPKDSFVIGFGANNLNDKRKGIKYIIESLNNLNSNKNLFIIYAGNQNLETYFNIKSQYFGKLKREQLCEFYNCCDLFLNSSLQDVGPYMIIEALMCGVPVVSFNTGFANDFIVNDQTGYIVDEISSKAFTEGIKRILNKNINEINKLKKECYERTFNLIALENQIQKYNKIITAIEY